MFVIVLATLLRHGSQVPVLPRSTSIPNSRRLTPAESDVDSSSGSNFLPGIAPIGLRLLFFLDLGALVPASSFLFLGIESSFVLEFLAPARL